MTYTTLLGALTQHALARLVGAVTALPDIEELESNRLSDLLGSLLTLSALFDEADVSCARLRARTTGAIICMPS